MKNHLLLSALTLLLLSLGSCKKNNTGAPEPPTTDPVVSDADFAKNFGDAASRSFIVEVFDATNNPVNGADVKIGSITAQTDAKGIAVIKNAAVFERFAYATVKKAGYIDGSRALSPAAGTSNIKIKLFSDKVTATVNSGAVSNVSLPNGVKVTFDGNFKTETGTPYTGQVNVILNGLEASDPDLFRKMPGMLFARNAAGDARLLETYGMLNVELRGSAGQKLQIANKAQIEMNITSAQLSTAAATMPLWHFDEALGYWKEEGLANKVGNKYVGEVAHFSWWNFDAPIQSPIVQLQIKLVDANAHPLANVKTVLFRQGGSASIASETAVNGTANGPVPANEVFTLKAYDACGNVVHTQNIGPFTVNTTLPDMVLNMPAAQYTTISGTLKKCDNTNVTNGYIVVNYGQQTFAALVINGAFSFQTIICGSNAVTIIAEDADSHQNTGTLNYTLSSPVTNIGNILACNTSSESITYSIDGGAPKIITVNINASSSSGAFAISGGSPVQMNDISITGNTSTPGIYSSASGIQIIGNGLATSLGSALNQFAITYNLTNVGGVGQYIDVSFSGTYQEVVMTGMSQGYNLSHTISGTAHVIRDN